MKKIKTNVTSIGRTNNQLQDLGYYEYNEVENLNILPRSIRKIKVEIRKDLNKFKREEKIDSKEKEKLKNNVSRLY